MRCVRKKNELDECSGTIKSLSEQLAHSEKLGLTEKPREGHNGRHDKKKKKKKSRLEGKMYMTPKKAPRLKPRTARPKVKKNPKEMTRRARSHGKHQAKSSAGLPRHPSPTDEAGLGSCENSSDMTICAAPAGIAAQSSLQKSTTEEQGTVI